jgi:hypothetical protein
LQAFFFYYPLSTFKGLKNETPALQVFLFKLKYSSTFKGLKNETPAIAGVFI